MLEPPGFFERFLREAQLGQTIRHDNVVRTLDCDQEFAGGKAQCFLVMECVERQTLSELRPEFQPVVPETGIGQSPTYEYRHREKAQTRYRERWVLHVGCSSGFLNWDDVVYFASGDYPTRGGNDPLQRIGDWACRHE